MLTDLSPAYHVALGKGSGNVTLVLHWLTSLHLWAAKGGGGSSWTKGTILSSYLEER